MTLYVSKENLAGGRPGALAFGSVAAALAHLKALPPGEAEGAVIELAPGLYRERIVIDIPGLTLKGTEGKERETVISGSAGAYEIAEDGRPRRTFRTQTVLITADGVRLADLTIENTAGPGHRAGQAIALHAYADRLSFVRVRLTGQQDTLFTGPLPEREIEPGGFTGPTEHFPRRLCRMHFLDCYIEGNIDFIFGGAAAYFERCELFARDSGDGRDTIAYVTAPSTPAGQARGYVMDHCCFSSDCPPESCFLGRPWREDAQAVFLHCLFGPHIKKSLFDDWGKEAAHRRSFFAVFDCRWTDGSAVGEGAAPWSHALSADEAAAYTKESVLSHTLP